MPTYPAYQLGVCVWVGTVLGALSARAAEDQREVVVDNAHGVAKGTPWAMVRILSDVSTGPAESRVIASGADAVYRTIARRRAVVSITLAENAHHDDAIALGLSLRQPAIKALLESLKIAVVRELSCVHLGADSDGTTQNRTVIDFEISHTHSTTSTPAPAALEATATGSTTT